jgi:hypothetical protein
MAKIKRKGKKINCQQVRKYIVNEEEGLFMSINKLTKGSYNENPDIIPDKSKHKISPISIPYSASKRVHQKWHS